MGRRNQIACAIVLVTMLGSVASGQQTIYVSQSGSDANPGISPDLPKRTITAALLSAASGRTREKRDVISVAAGTYGESVVVDKAVFVVGAGNATVIVPPAGIGIEVRSNNVDISALALKQAPNYGLYAYGVSNLRIADVLCEGNTQDGILLVNASAVYLDRITSRSNLRHGLNIGDGSNGITITGGDFSANGSGGFLSQTGAGINMYSDNIAVSSVTLVGPMTISQNTATGMWMSAPSLVGSIQGVTI
ncbi:MAG: right-handed parallel beta-helix repeat-containing protein, partial [Ignavibacteriales bacterium]|nr:right-handed parallel beta-helix repeat-containing protein [Ignavibacteriales bacterium]